jgi:3-methyl-2-oxobutanoate hydroxymethyltransferase
MRTTLSDLQQMKSAGERIAMITSYDAPSAALAEAAGAPVLLVGDSLGMVMHGQDTTLPVTLDQMITHAAAVVRSSQSALVVGDLPFLTYATPQDAIHAAGRMMREAQVQAVKLEGGAHMAETIRLLTRNGVPVMGHLGFTPQSQHQLGVKVQARDAEGARRLIEDALALQEAGAFAIVLELVPAPLAAEVTKRLSIPTIGIGAGAGCDGQVQVWHDILGLFDTSPRHAKRYAEIGAAIKAAVTAYVDDVKSGAFPTGAQSSKMDEAVLAEALRGL